MITQAQSEALPPRSTGPLVLLTSIIASSVIGLDSAGVLIALPAIGSDLDAPLSQQTWVSAGFLLPLGTLLLVGGAIGDVFDRWRVFALSTAAFGAATLICALAPTAETLIAGRVLQGTAAAFLVPSCLAVLSESFHGADLDRAIGAWTAWTSVATLTGPLIAGVLVELSWRWVFLLTVPLAFATALLIVRAAPADAHHPRRGSVDMLGAALGAGVIGGPIFALIQGPVVGWSEPLVLAALVLGAVCAPTFIIHERRAPKPLVPLTIFRNATFTAVTLATFALYASMIGGALFIGLFLQQIAGFSPLESSIRLVIAFGLLLALSRLAGSLADRLGPRRLIAAGSLLIAAGFVLWIRVDASATILGDVLPAAALIGLGMAAAIGPLTSAALGTLGEQAAGTASGVNNAVARVASLTGVAVFGLIVSLAFAVRIDRQVDNALATPAIQRAVQAAKAQPLVTLTPTGLADAEQEQVQDATQQAATFAFHVSMGTAAGLAVLSALAMAWGAPLRRSLRLTRRHALDRGLAHSAAAQQ